MKTIIVLLCFICIEIPHLPKYVALVYDTFLVDSIAETQMFAVFPLLFLLKPKNYQYDMGRIGPRAKA